MVLLVFLPKHDDGRTIKHPLMHLLCHLATLVCLFGLTLTETRRTETRQSYQNRKVKHMFTHTIIDV